MEEQDTMREHLEKAFSNVNEWLKFAEQKNAALIAFNSAVVFGLLSLSLPPNVVLRGYVYLAVALLAIAVILALASFIPRTRIPWVMPRSRNDEDDNLLFFGHAANYTPERYLAALAKALGETPEPCGRIEKMYAEQIVMNSKIALYKYSCFTAGIWLTLSAFLTPIPAAIHFIVAAARKGHSR